MSRDLGGGLNFTERVKLLDRIYRAGHWGSQSQLMGDAIGAHPSSFKGLTPEDLDKCIYYGNRILAEAGIPEIWPKPEDFPGRCESLWQDEGPVPPWRKSKFASWTSQHDNTEEVPEEDTLVIAEPEHSHTLTVSEMPTIGSNNNIVVETSYGENLVFDTEYATAFEFNANAIPVQYEMHEFNGLTDEPSEPDPSDEDVPEPEGY